MGPLDGIRVVDLTERAGRLGARLLADLGADVVRPEGLVSSGDPHWPAAGDLAARLWLDEGKRPLWLERHESGEIWQDERMTTLVAGADIVLDGRSGVGAGELSGLSGRTVVVRITPFGLDNPRSAWRASDLILAARGGMVATNGHADGEPLQPFGQQAYNTCGLWACIAALLGLRIRDATGAAPAIDLAAQAAVVSSLEHATGLWRQNGANPRRQGTLHWTRSFRVGPCSDGLVLQSLYGDWTSLVEWVCAEAEEPLLREPAFEVSDARAAAAEDLFDILDRFSATQPRDAFCEHATLLRLPMAPVREPHELASDEQIWARGAREVVLSGRRMVLPPPPAELSLTPFQRGGGLLEISMDEADRAGGRDPGEVARSRSGWSAQPDRSGTRPRPEGSGQGLGMAREPTASSSSASPADKPPLAGVQVLDFTWVVAGPVTTRILADQGASVLKIERFGAPDFGDRRGGLSGNLNRGKKSLVLDMARPEGRAIACDLAALSDLVVDNFSSRVMVAWGLDYLHLRARRRDAIALRMTGFGATGPRKNDSSYGPTLQALAALPLLMRHPDGAPAGYGWSWSDTAAGLMGAMLALAALDHRDHTGEGQQIDLSQFANLVALIGPTTPDLLAGRPPEPVGNGSQEGPAVPHGVFPCQSRRRPGGLSTARNIIDQAVQPEADEESWLALAVLDPSAWRALARELERDGEVWALDPALDDLAGRLAQRVKVETRLADWTRRHDAELLESRLQRVGVPAALVATGEDLCRDVVLRARGFFEQVAVPATAGVEALGAATRPAGDLVEVDGIPFRTTAGRGRVLAPGPLLGEHTSEILGEGLGYSSQRIAELRQRGIVG